MNSCPCPKSVASQVSIRVGSPKAFFYLVISIDISKLNAVDGYAVPAVSCWDLCQHLQCAEKECKRKSSNSFHGFY